MTSPLATDGSNFPCKGYLTRPDAHVTASFSAGQQANFTLAGSATHGGGSCQISLSYDGGVTFKVINTILGGCPLQNTYDFQFPSGLPAGNNVVFSWSWFNKVGNREMYQNCALVNIAGTGSQSFLATLPDIQVANVNNGCNSIESIEVIPEDPGSYVQYGGSYAAGPGAVNGLNGAGLVGTCGAPVVARPAAVATSSSSSSLKTTSSAISSTLATSSVAAAGRVGFKAGTTTVAVVAAPVTTSKAAAPTSVSSTSGQSCTNGAIICTGTGYTWSLCSAGTAVAMGAVAPGTICKNGQMLADTSPATTVTAGNVVKASSSAPVRAAFTIVAPTTTKIAPAATTTNACLNKREARDSCQIFTLKCLSPSEYSLCEGDNWGAARALSLDQVCNNGEISSIASANESQLRLSTKALCSGTGIICSEDGLSYYICDGEASMPVPAGTRCLESAAGGGFVSWNAS